MIAYVVAAVALSTASYLLGTLAHEATHVAACLGTGSRIRSMGYNYVEYEAPSHRADAVIRAAPVAISLVIVVRAAMQVAELGLTPSSIFIGAFVFGYVPRSPGDWRGLREAVAAYSSESA